MRISKSEWFVGFGLWAGAWAIVHIVDGLFFDLQLALMQPGHSELPFDIATYPLVGALLTLLLSFAITKQDILKLLITYVVFSLVFEFTDSLFWILFGELCSGSNCWSYQPYFVPATWPQIYFLEWQNLLLEISGYVLAWLLVSVNRMSVVPGFNKGQTIIQRTLAWLQFDTVEQGRFWRWWLSLPLWSYAAPVRVFFRKIWPPFFAIAATNSAANLFSIIVFPFASFLTSSSYVEGQNFQILTGILSGLPGYLVLLITALSFGRLSRDIGFTITPVFSVFAWLVYQVNSLAVTGASLSTGQFEGPIYLLIQMVIVCAGLSIGNHFGRLAETKEASL